MKYITIKGKRIFARCECGNEYRLNVKKAYKPFKCRECKRRLLKIVYGTLTGLGFIGLACAFETANQYTPEQALIIGLIGLAMFIGGVFGLKKEGVIE